VLLFIPHITNLLNRRRGLRNIIQRLPLKHQLVLDIRRNRHLDTVVQGHPANVLFAQEVADLNDLAVLDDVDVDGEMGVYVAHFVAESLDVRMLATSRGNGGLVWVGKGLGVG